jgi:N utilization substance protein B
VRRTDQRRAAVFACYQSEVTGTPVEKVLGRGGIEPRTEKGKRSHPERPERPVTEFTRELALGVAEQLPELDGLIAAHAVGWELERIAPLERSILRVALFEVLHRPDVPDEVAIDEAVETAKIYCGADAPGFVNGILGGVMKRMAREAEGGRDD